MAQSAKRTETLVGLFLFIGLALLGGLVMQFGRLGDRFKAVYTVKVVFNDASGVIKGSQVKLAGADVGQVVKQPRLTSDGKVMVEMCIREDTPKLDKNSIFQIKSMSVLGDKAIVISRPEPENLSGAYLKDGDEIAGGGPSGLEALQSDALDIASDAAVLMARAQTTLSKIDNALDEVRAVTGLLTESVDNVNNGLLSQENMQNFSDALVDLRGASENIKVASTDLQPVLEGAESAFKSFGDASDSAQVAFARASSEIEKIGPALDRVPEAVDSIAQVADDASDVLKSVKNENGVAGALIYDEQPAEDAKVFLRNLRHYGILRYRDAETYDERDPRNRFRGRRR